MLTITSRMLVNFGAELRALSNQIVTMKMHASGSSFQLASVLQQDSYRCCMQLCLATPMLSTIVWTQEWHQSCHRPHGCAADLHSGASYSPAWCGCTVDLHRPADYSPACLVAARRALQYVRPGSCGRRADEAGHHGPWNQCQGRAGRGCREAQARLDRGGQPRAGRHQLQGEACCTNRTGLSQGGTATLRGFWAVTCCCPCCNLRDCLDGIQSPSQAFCCCGGSCQCREHAGGTGTSSCLAPGPHVAQACMAWPEVVAGGLSLSTGMFP